MTSLALDQTHAIVASVTIPPKPTVLEYIQQELAKPELDINAFADIIASDVAMAAAILKTVNSSRFGLSRSISDIKQGVMLLGSSYIATFANEFQLKNMLGKQSSISFEKFWATAAQTADMMMLAHEYLDLKQQCQKEDAYAFAIFRECGIPLLSIKFANYKDILIEANSSPEMVFTEIEDRHLNTNHAVIGYFLARSWNLPDFLVDLILRHHETELLTDNQLSLEHKHLFALSKLAVNVLQQQKNNQDSSEWLLVRDNVLRHFHMSDMDYVEMEADLIEHFNIING